MQEDFSDPQVLAAERGDPDPRDQPLTPLERLAVEFDLTGHEEDVDAFQVVDFYMREYANTTDPLTQDAKDLQNFLLDVLETWTPKR